MGYEVQVFLGERRRDFDENHRDYFSVVATVDLAVPDDAIKRLCDSSEGDPVYMYASDGNRRLTQDCYGNDLVAIPAERLLVLLEPAFESSKPDYGGAGYRRYELAIPMLKVLIDRFKNPCVVLYGH